MKSPFRRLLTLFSTMLLILLTAHTVQGMDRDDVLIITPPPVIQQQPPLVIVPHEPSPFIHVPRPHIHVPPPFVMEPYPPTHPPYKWGWHYNKPPHKFKHPHHPHKWR